MDVDYDEPEGAAEVADRVRTFVDEVVLPLERDRIAGDPISDDTVAELRGAAREYDVYAPQVDEAYGGMGLDLRTAVPAIEQAARSALGPPAIRAGAPDQGNMYLLERRGTDAQKDRWLRPLVAGDIASAFSLTEPPPGAGSDPSMLKTTAERDGDEWVIDGHKWWTTQGVEADLLFVLARTRSDPGSVGQCTLFLVPADTEGVTVVRDIPSAGQHGRSGHAEIRYDSVRVPDDAVLGDVHAGLRHARERVPASRLGRCVRSVGMAVRALDVTAAYAREREAFGEPLAAKGPIRFELADAAADLHAARTLVRRTARRFAADEDVSLRLAACLVVTGRAVERVVSRAAAACGANGVARDLPLADFYSRVRPTHSRLGDAGQLRTIANHVLDDREIDPNELDPMTRF